MNIFRKKENFITDEKQQSFITNGLGQYFKYNQSIMLYPEDLPKKAQTLKEEYINSITSIISYLRTTLTDFRLDNASDFPTNINPLELDIQNMLADCPNIIANFIKPQNLPDTIYILDEKHSPHIHLSNQEVEMAENLECLPNLDRLLTKNNLLNKMVEGLNIFESRALLKQMNLLPSNNHLEQVLSKYEERLSIHRHLIIDIIDNLLSSNDPHDIKRAHIFLSYFDIKYTLPEEPTISEPKILKYTNHNC